MGEIKIKDKCIFERVYVETPVDTDGDGKLDLIAVYIRRPESTMNGVKVPAVYVANPYMMTCNEDWYDLHNVDKPLKVYETQNINEANIKYDFSTEPLANPSFVRETKGYADSAIIEDNIDFECISELYSHLNARGYASIFAGGLGTRGSDGYVISGSREEILAFKSVIDWLNGRTRAFTNKEDNIEIKATWCTGKTAMSAKSYLGTMCFGVAATGVEGLETIIPEAGITNWYGYFRYNGLTAPALGWQGDDIDLLSKYCFSRTKDAEDYAKTKNHLEVLMNQMIEAEDRESGNYNKFWDERNYMNLMDNIKASVFIIHGINDWNVKTNQCFPYFEELQRRNIPRKIMAHQGEHVYIYNLRDSDCLSIIDRWLDHYLKGEENGIEKEPKVLIQSNIDQRQWLASESWPPENVKTFDFPVNGKGDVTFVDDISKTCYNRESDNLKEWLDELVLSDKKDYNNRIKYVYRLSQNPEFKGKPLRISGTCKVNMTLALNRPTAILSAMIVDLGEAKRITSEEVKIGNEYVFGTEAEDSKYKVISRGWLNAQNRTNNWSKEELKIGKFYDYSFDMVPTDYTIEVGHDLGLIIYGIDAEETLRPDTVTEITVKQEKIKIEIQYVI